MSGEHDPKLKVRIDGVAVPEIMTGKVPEEELEESQEEIQYDNVAIPEIHLSKRPEDSASR